MKIYKVSAEIQIGRFSDRNSFELMVVEHECKETNQSYVWDGRRLKKDEIGKLKLSDYGVSHIRYGIYILPEQLEEAKIQVVEAVKKLVNMHYEKALAMKQMIEIKEPDVKFRKREDYL